MSGNQKSSWASSPAAYDVRDDGSGGRQAGRSSATLVRSVRPEYGHPIRSAITLAGIVGYAASSSRIRGSNASATDPFGSRSYLGGPSDRSAARTVFRDTFLIRAICLIGSPSARWSRLISAQSSTSITCFLPGSVRARIPGRGVKFRLPRRGQYSASADTHLVASVVPGPVGELDQAKANGLRRPSARSSSATRGHNRPAGRCLARRRARSMKLAVTSAARGRAALPPSAFERQPKGNLARFAWWRVIRWLRTLHRWMWNDVRRACSLPGAVDAEYGRRDKSCSNADRSSERVNARVQWEYVQRLPANDHTAWSA